MFSGNNKCNDELSQTNSLFFGTGIIVSWVVSAFINVMGFIGVVRKPVDYQLRTSRSLEQEL